MGPGPDLIKLFSVDLRYAGIWALSLANKSHMMIISQSEVYNSSIAQIYAENIFIRSGPEGLNSQPDQASFFIRPHFSKLFPRGKKLTRITFPKIQAKLSFGRL